MATVQFLGVSLLDGRKMLYKGLEFTLGDRELGAVFGPSHSGKVSVLLLAEGALKPSEGQVLVDGRPPEKKRIGLAPIHTLTPLFDTLTVEEHLVFQARLYGVRNPKLRAGELMELLRLKEVRKYRIKEIGALGQFHTGLASALVHRPYLVLVDEPERGLTNAEWEEAYGDLRRLADDGHTVLLTTVLAQVAERCDLVVELPSGEVTRR
jgi:ABC-type multidrug transport system ATPase subunit